MTESAKDSGHYRIDFSSRHQLSWWFPILGPASLPTFYSRIIFERETI